MWTNRILDRQRAKDQRHHLNHLPHPPWQIERIMTRISATMMPRTMSFIFMFWYHILRRNRAPSRLKSAAWNNTEEPMFRFSSSLLFWHRQVQITKLLRYKQKLATNTDPLVELLCPCDKPIDLYSAINGLKYFNQIAHSEIVKSKAQR